MEQFFQNILQPDMNTTWLFHFLLMVLVSMIPFAPIPVLATFIATNYSFSIGLAINLGGTSVGSILLYICSKYVIRTFSQNYLARHKNLTNFMFLVQRNGFLAVLLGRIVPILPSAGINIIAGICNVSFLAFVAATIIGKLPTIVAFSLAGHQMAAGNWDIVSLIGVSLLLILLVARKLKQHWIK